MPGRITKRRVQSDKAQGKGSWVDFKPMTFGERDAMREEILQHQEDEDGGSGFAVELQRRLFTDHIIDWNWLDENDAPLPVPSKDASVIDGLTDEEIGFLDGLFALPANRGKS